MRAAGRSSTVVSVGGVHGQPRPLHREHRVPGDRAATSRARASRSISWVLNAYAIVFAALLVPAGPHRRSRTAAGARSSGASSSSCSARRCAASRPSVEPLVGARVIQAIGARAAAADLAGAAAARVRARGAAAGDRHLGRDRRRSPPPPARRVGGLLVEVSWRLVFLVNVPIGLAAIAYRRCALLRESRDERQARPDLLGLGALRGAIGVLALGLVKAPGLGLGRRPHARLRSPLRPSASPPSGRRCLHAPLAGRSTRDCCACARSRSRASPRCCSRPPSRRSCSPTCSS